MRHRHVGPLLRSLAPARPAAADADPPGRVAAGRGGEAFAELVGRHGRLVWAVCRPLAGPDADDAFQATFLVLLRSAARIRAPDPLPAWLHGVACRVCARARRAARRRAARERAAAVPDRAGAAVPDSAWGRALAAVLEEVARPPEALRVPFVLCALEGRTVTEAAGRLGWKVTTLSARLGRAKAALLARLPARGLAAGAAVAVAVVPKPVPAAVAGSTAVAAGGGTVAGRIQFLTHGVVAMSAHHVKLEAAGALLALGLGVGGGAGRRATAGAQVPERAPAVAPEEKVRHLEAQLDRAKRELEDQRAAGRRAAADEVARLATARWQYAFVWVHDVDAEGFVQLLREREARGWEYTGQATVKKEAVWVFRRPAGGQLGPPAGRPGRADGPEWLHPGQPASGGRPGVGGQQAVPRRPSGGPAEAVTTEAPAGRSNPVPERSAISVQLADPAGEILSRRRLEDTGAAYESGGGAERRCPWMGETGGGRAMAPDPRRSRPESF